MLTIRIPLALLLIALPFTAVWSQDELADEVPEIRRYTVEMIIFRYAQEVSTGTEIFLADEPAIDAPAFEDETESVEEELLEEIPRFYRDIDLVLLEEDEYAMGDILRRLERLDVYEPMMHFGWTQNTWPDEGTLPIELGDLGRLPDGLDGTLRLYRGRFLHLVVDVALDGPTPADAAASPSSYGDGRSLTDYYEAAIPRQVRYRINEDRILRSGELRYFDHPKFGVLAKVSRVENEPEETPDTTETELLGYPPE